MIDLTSKILFNTGLWGLGIGMLIYVIFWILYYKIKVIKKGWAIIGNILAGIGIIICILAWILGFLYWGAENYTKDHERRAWEQQATNTARNLKISAQATAEALRIPKLETKTNIYSLNLEKNVSYSNNINGKMGGGFLLGFGAIGGSVSGSGNTTIEFRYYFYKQVEDGYMLYSVSSNDTILVESDKEEPCLKVYDKGYNKLIIPLNTIRKEFSVVMK